MTNAGTIVGNISLGTGNDSFTTIGSGAVTGKIDGGTGFDTFRGGDLSDTFFGGDQADNMRGGGGSDEIFGEAGNDLIIADADGVADLYDGGDGVDNVSYVTTVAGINANLGLNFAFGTEIGVDRLESVENLTGGRGNDSLTGAASTQRLDGGAGNDLLRGLPLPETEANLRAILQGAKAKDIDVLLLGVTAPETLGPDAKQSFDALYPRLAEEEGVAFSPALLSDLIGEHALLQADGLHPTAEGHVKLAEALEPTLLELVRSASEEMAAGAIEEGTAEEGAAEEGASE